MPLNELVYTIFRHVIFPNGFLKEYGIFFLSERLWADFINIRNLYGIESNNFALQNGLALQHIRDQLWYCDGGNITIYDGDLKMIRKIKHSIRSIFSIADLGNNIAVASSDGLFLMPYMGKIYIIIFKKNLQ